MITKKNVELAIDNIYKYGDTDIFPFPIENLIFHDSRKDIFNFIKDLDKNYEVLLDKLAPVNINTCSTVGYTGLRWVTQVDPIWNLYLLSLVISIGDKIEKCRIPVSKGYIYSYRYNPDLSKATLFEENTNWKLCQEESLKIVENEDFTHVLSCDVADFYNRIYHHRLDNALRRIVNDETPKKIMKIVQKFSGTNSYGLPIGGPASRILAELSLNNIDKILKLNSIRFSRFVDDFYLFAHSREEAHRHLNFLAIKLMSNEGLTLQKNKTQIYTKSEFVSLIKSRLLADSDDDKTNERAKFMSLPVRYDPYSNNAEAEYKKIKKELEKFNIIELLNEELRKTRIHQQFSKHLIKALSVLDSAIVSEAFISIFKRIENLYPIIPNIMIAVHANYDKLSIEAKQEINIKLSELISNNSYVIQIDLNAAYIIRVLGKEYSDEREELLNKLSIKFSDSILVQSVSFPKNRTVYEWTKIVHLNSQNEKAKNIRSADCQSAKRA